jgi:hypothetical protein
MTTKSHPSDRHCHLVPRKVLDGIRGLAGMMVADAGKSIA